ncbi:MAG TPA: type II toxin-antitoxin system HigB family toxin [Ktedonobacterales bacterium]|nr:type II toxin-antitoxin system HigB family toxin [Ktedonobacterales bacterium]
MRILDRPDLIATALRHGDCLKQVERWCNIASAATWQSLAEVRRTFRDADSVGGQTVFNIKGNRYRLIVNINYKLGIIKFEQLLTHAEYDKGNWKH